MSSGAAGVRRAAVLGTVTGARTFLAPAALALRGRLGKAAKFALPVLAVGELVADKLPAAPPRIEGPGLVARVVSGAVSGRVSGGARGARVGAAFALASAYPSQSLRATITRRTSVPDVAYAVPEDLLAATLATAASSEPRPGVDGPKTPDMVEFSAHQHGGPHGIVTAAALGLAAAAVGAAAMTSAQQWLHGLTGEEGSEAAPYALYGPSWGFLFGVVLGRGERPPGPTRGLAFGLSVWAASLVALPALGVASPPQRQSPGALAQGLALHLVYGSATAAAYEAFAA